MKFSEPAKSEILATIRNNLTESAAKDHLAHFHGPPIARLVRDHIDGLGQMSSGDILSEFRNNLEAVKGNCYFANGFGEISEITQKIVDQLRPVRIAISDAPMVSIVSSMLKTGAQILSDAAPPQLFDCALGITSAQWGIAETGTLVIDSSKERNRFASLIPDVHVCFLNAVNVRNSMSEILQLLAADLSPAVTFITGPSRTSDIELTLAIGVHGPRELHVIVYNDVPAGWADFPGGGK